MRAKFPPARLLRGFGLSLWVALVAFGVALPDALAQRKKVELPQGAIKPDDLFIVDCLLPPQVRQLGESFTYLSARRPARLPARECAIRGGEYVAYDRANYGTALKTWLPAAKEGNPDAMNSVGEIYEKGLGVEPDYETARMWYAKAAEKGHSGAMINLGSLYERGAGVGRDMVQAMNWYRKASGLGESQLELVSEADRAQRLADAEELERLRGETLRLTGELAQAREQLKQRQAELARVEADLGKARGDLARVAANSAEAQAMKARIAELEKSLVDRQVDVAQSRAATQSALAQLSGNEQASADGAPKISVISPRLSLTRAGVLAAPLLAAVPSYQVIGRVTPVDGLRALKVNDRDVAAKVDEDGLFEVEVPLLAGDTPIEIQAVARDGRSTIESFVLSALDSGNLSGDKRLVSNMFARRMRSDLGSYHALVIGNQTYSQFTPLATPLADARAVAEVLKERYGYQVQLLTDASRTQMLQALAELSTRLKKTDNLLIYYAGHGQLDAAGDGHWVPVEGERGRPETWVSNKAVTDFLGAMAAKHVLVVADSCYSGAIGGSAIRPLPKDAKEEDILFISRVKARTAITSGGLEPVLDSEGGQHSIFASAFLKALRSASTLAEGSQVFADVRAQVQLRASVLRVQQRPAYSALKFAGHEGSEFFFLPKDA